MGGWSSWPWPAIHLGEGNSKLKPVCMNMPSPDIQRLFQQMGRRKSLFRRVVIRFKIAWYILDIMRQTACLVFNPIMVEGYAALFSCTAVVQASDAMTASM